MADPIIGSPEWLAQQKQQAQESNIKTAPTGYNPPTGTISSSIFTPTPSLAPATPQVSPPSGVPQISTPPLVETPKEQEASDLTTRLQQLQDTLAGKPAFKQQEEKQFDVAGKTQLVQDLTAQYNDLLAQSKNIPERLQLEATGRGITAGGLEPIQTGELRKLSIASNTIAAQLQAAQGNLQFAQSLVDKAVNDQYAPTEAELTAKAENLKLIIDSPEYSIQDKNRAQAQADAIENQKNAIADEKQNKKDVLTEVNNAIKNGLTDPNIIAYMKGQKTGTDAALIAAEAGFGQPKLKTGAIAQFEELYGRKPTPQEYFDFIRKEKEAIKLNETKSDAIINAENKLLSSKGKGGFVDPNVYLSEREKSTLNPSDFDKRFGHLLSPQERKNLQTEKRETASTISPQDLQDLTDDIQKGATLSQLYSAYSDISPSFINSTYLNFLNTGEINAQSGQ